ncbi:DUF6631 family protein [Leminorella grimontii]|uniref:DUF6631 family protein n=1 Tax=Leminorella grimontii TaxID=82981 RepID=UPI00321F821D
MDDSLNTMFPERHAEINGVAVQIHEYTLAEQLRHRQPLKAITDAFAQLLTAQTPQSAISLDALYDVLATLENEVIEAVAIACSQKKEWVAALSGPDSETLLLLWWGVNADFFTRSALRPALENMARQAMASRQNGEPSFNALSTTGTDSTT